LLTPFLPKLPNINLRRLKEKGNASQGLGFKVLS
jgi:hypothetical protein